MIEGGAPELSVARQCKLVGLPRSSLYYRPRGESQENLELMRQMDEAYTNWPFYGVRRMTAYFRRQGYTVNPKRVRRLMKLMGLEAIYPRKRLSVAAAEHRHYPYLLTGVEVERPDQVWSTDITYIRLRRGFLYLVAVAGLVQPVRALLGPVGYAGGVVLRVGVGGGPGEGTPGDLQHRPGEPVHQRGLHGLPRKAGDRDQHGRSGSGV